MTSPTPLRARTPEDLLAAVPVVLGFEPHDSLVVLTFGGRETFSARLDLGPSEDADAAVALLLRAAQRHGVTHVVLILYGDDGIACRGMLRRTRRALGGAGIEVAEVLRVHRGRWFAPDRPGAPSEGVAFDVRDHPFRARAVAEGIVVHTSRAELVSLLQPRPAGVAEVARAVRRAVPSPPEELRDLVDLRLGTGRFPTAELARVLLGLQEPEGRDAGWGAMSRDLAAGHVRLWTDAVQRSPDDLVAGPAAVLAIAAWLAGDGALAWCAVDRCRSAEPDNTLAALVCELLTQAVPPSAWASEGAAS